MNLEGGTGESHFTKVREAWANVVVRQGVCAGIGVQVAQQFVGINTVMYYSPTLVQLSGVASNKTALLLSLITSGLNAVGSVVGICFVDRVGRKKLMLLCLAGVIACLAMLTGVFIGVAKHSPAVGNLVTAHFRNMTCPGYKLAQADSWHRMKCLKASSDCGCCANATYNFTLVHALSMMPTQKNACGGQHRLWYTRGCPSSFGWLALVGLGLYIIAYSPGMGTVPWVLNAEIYLLKFRGPCGGMAAVANRVANLIVTQAFLSLSTQALGTAYAFLLFCLISCVALVFTAVLFVPETKGLHFEEVEKVLEKRSLKSLFHKEFSSRQLWDIRWHG